MTKSRKICGFALPELMVALLFLSIGVFAYISLQIFLIGHSNRFENSLKAQKAAQSWMNAAVYGLVYNQIFEKEMAPVIPASQLPENLVSMDITVEDAPAALAPAGAIKTLQRVEVVLVWNEKTGAKTYRITSYVEKAGEEL